MSQPDTQRCLPHKLFISRGPGTFKSSPFLSHLACYTFFPVIFFHLFKFELDRISVFTKGDPKVS